MEKLLRQKRTFMNLLDIFQCLSVEFRKICTYPLPKHHWPSWEELAVRFEEVWLLCLWRMLSSFRLKGQSLLRPLKWLVIWAGFHESVWCRLLRKRIHSLTRELTRCLWLAIPLWPYTWIFGPTLFCSNELNKMATISIFEDSTQLDSTLALTEQIILLCLSATSSLTLSTWCF